jgi:sugar-phosphatase
MSAPRQILAAIFDMDGLIMDSEPLWDRAELEVMASLGLILPAAMSYRIPLACALIWLLACGSPAALDGPDCEEVTHRIISRAITLVEETRPLLPGAREAIACAKPAV